MRNSIADLRRRYQRREQRGKRVEEALVLRLGADRDAQRAGAAQRAAGADEDAALGEALEDLALDLGGLVVLARREVEPDEVGLRLGGLDAEPAQPVLEPDPLGEVALDAAGDLVLVVERLERGGLGGGVAEERLADLVDGGAEVLRAAQREADAQPAQAVDLARRCAAARGSGAA